MRPEWNRCRRWCVVVAQGGLLLGVLQGLSMVSFAQLFTEFLIQWLSALVALLLGGNPSTLLA